MSQIVNEALKAVVYEANGEPEHPAAFDPTAYIPLALSLLDILKECMAARRAKGADGTAAANAIKEAAAHPTILQHIQINRHLRKNLGRKEFRANGQKYTQAMLKVTATAFPEKILELSEADSV